MGLKKVARGSGYFLNCGLQKPIFTFAFLDFLGCSLPYQPIPHWRGGDSQDEQHLNWRFASYVIWLLVQLLSQLTNTVYHEKCHKRRTQNIAKMLVFFQYI